MGNYNYFRMACIFTLIAFYVKNWKDYTKDNDHVFHFMLYSHIQYNGVDYYQTEEQVDFFIGA